MVASLLSLLLTIVHCSAQASDHGRAPGDLTHLIQQSAHAKGAIPAVHAPAQAAPCSSMGYRENRFRVAWGLTDIESQTFTYTNGCGYDIDLTGWTETRDCHEGFSRNISGNATAVVRGLTVGLTYKFRIFQIAYSYGGSNPLAVNGESCGNTQTTQTADPSKTGQAMPDSTGRITFTFTREASHVSLAGIAISEAPQPSPPRAVDDPHLVNIQGQRFDVLQPRTHTLLQIPRGAATAHTLLRVDATMRSFGANCAELYIRTLHVAGRWANEATGGPLTFHAGGDGLGRRGSSGVTLGTGDIRALTGIRSAPPRGVKWIQDGPREKGIISRVAVPLGPTRAVIDWMRTQRKGMKLSYLNLRVFRLGQVNNSIGGLLGLDDHSFAASMPEECKATSALSALSESPEQIPLQAVAMAEASLY